MRILVTGATGFVGIHLLRALRDAHHDAIEASFDILDRAAVRDTIARICPDGLIHLAA